MQVNISNIFINKVNKYFYFYFFIRFNHKIVNILDDDYAGIIITVFYEYSCNNNAKNNSFILLHF